MIPNSKRSLPPEAFARIARLELRARGVVEGFLTGLHRSPYFGQSAEFVQHRDYVAGDDFRRIDWKVWSKTDKYYIKQYEDETNLRTSILLDASESMRFASAGESKWEFGRIVSAALSYLLLKQQDAVGLTLFDESITSRLPTSSKQSHMQEILVALDRDPGSRKTALSDILGKFADELSQRGMVVVISDLLADRAGLKKGLSMLRRRGHDVLVFHVLDDAELDFPYSGTTKFEGLEKSGDLLCDPRSLREGYLTAMQTFLDDVRRFCAADNIDYQLIRTSEPVDAVLRTFLSRRESRRR